MAKFKWNDDVLDLMCSNPGCEERVCDMSLIMTHHYHLENVDSSPGVCVYGMDDTGWGITHSLVCSCGRVYQGGKDYTIEWNDDGWSMVIKHSEDRIAEL